MTTFNVYEKILKNDEVSLVNVFANEEAATKWADHMMDIWIEDRAYKVVEEDLDVDVLLEAFKKNFLSY